MAGPSVGEARDPAVKTMRAAVITGPGRVEIEHLTLPEPGPGEVRIRLHGCGICGSNLPLWEGRPWFQYPTAPGGAGHEGWGVVDLLGAGVTGLTPGQRVAALSYRAFAEYDIAQQEALVPLPDSVGGSPFPGEALGCAMNIFRRSDIEPGHTVAIVGIGFLGAILTRLASRAGARVIAITRRRFALDLASELGASVTLPLDNQQAIAESVRSMTGGKGADRVIEAVGLQAPLDLATELTRIRGRLIIAGYHQDGVRQVDMQTWNWKGIDVINAHERDPAAYIEGIRTAVEAVASGVLDPSPLYTHSFPLAQLGQALETVRQRPDGFIKAVVLP